MRGEEAAFPSSYAIERPEELPADNLMQRFYFPGGSRVGGRDGLIVAVAPPSSAPWAGIFSFGWTGVTGTFACPDPDQLCVVARGAGYIVSAIRPSQGELFEALPVLGVYPVVSAGLLIFANFTELTAIGREGIAWRTEQLAWDELQVDSIRDGWVHGRGWSAPEDRYVAFAVDLRTGAHEGGAYILKR